MGHSIGGILTNQAIKTVGRLLAPQSSNTSYAVRSDISQFAGYNIQDVAVLKATLETDYSIQSERQFAGICKISQFAGYVQGGVSLFWWPSRKQATVCVRGKEGVGHNILFNT